MVRRELLTPYGLRTLARSEGNYKGRYTGDQMTRDALSTALFDVTGVIAGHRWTDAEIPSLLLQLNAAMAGEVQALAALPPLPPPPDRHQLFKENRDGQPARIPCARPDAQHPAGR